MQKAGRCAVTRAVFVFFLLITTSKVWASTPTQLAFSVQPSNTVAGNAITPAIQVAIQDSTGATVTTATNSVTLAIGTNPGGGTLAGTVTVAAVNGIATFSTLSINKAGTGYTLIATSTGLTTATSAAFTVTVGAASKLGILVQPGNSQAGSSIAPAMQVAVQDTNGNLVTTATNTITIAIGTNPGGGTLAGTLSSAAVNGVATFSTLSINKVGTGYTLKASATGLTAATSTTFNITPGAAAKLAVKVQPSTSAAGVNITPAMQISIQDVNGNLVTTATNTITVSIGTNPAGGVLAGTTSVAAVAGVATFSAVNIDKPGKGYTLTAASTGLTSITSAAFNVDPLVTLSGTIATNMTLVGTNIYRMTGNVTVSPGVVLMIEPGTIIKVDGNLALTVYGSLYATGTSASKVFFTSWKDDTLGGDTNADGTATTPAAGNWTGVLAGPDSIVQLQYCELRYAGNSASSNAVIDVNNALYLDLENSTITDSAVRGIYGVPASFPCTWTITSNTIQRCATFGMELFSNAYLTASIRSNTIQNNTGAGLCVAGDFAIGSNTLTANGSGNSVHLKAGNLLRSSVWTRPTGVSTFVLDGSITIPTGMTLTLAAGSTLKFSFNTVLTVNGSLLAPGTSASKIYFTSIKDDSVGGDTNGDGAATTAAPADWAGIYGSSPLSLSLIYCEVRYAGNPFNAGAISLGYPTLLDIENSIITDSGTRGLYVTALAGNLGTWTIKNNTVQRCAMTGVELYPLPVISITITGNTVKNNTGAGFYIPADLDVSSNTMTANGYANAVRMQGKSLNNSITWRPPTGGTTLNVEGAVNVPVTAVLNVAAGTTVKMSAGSYISVNGEFYATGTATSKVYFTSAKDDTVGGDTNGDAGATIPAAGDWGGISVSGGCTLQLKYSEIRWAGGGNSGAVNSSSTNNFDIENCTLTDSASAGIYAVASTIGSWTIKNNIVQRCKTQGMDLIANNPGPAVTLTGNTIQNNTGEGLFVTPSIDVSTNTMTANGHTNAVHMTGGTLLHGLLWKAPSGSNTFYLDAGVTVPAGMTLTINAGTTVKFAGNSALILSGSLVGVGTSTSKIYLTSLKDDTVGGDTNADAATTTPAAGDWNGLSLGGGSSIQLIYSELRYAGNPVNNAAINASSPASFDVENSIITDSASEGISLYPPTTASNWIIKSNTVQRCASRGMELNANGNAALTWTISSNTIQNNVGAGLEISPDINVGGNTLTANGNANAVRVKNLALSRSAVWQLPVGSSTFYVQGGLTIPTGMSLTVPSGSNVKMTPNSVITINGTLIAQGNAASKIYFTSDRDDTLGGDTNGDGAATTPAVGNWSGLNGSFASLQLGYVEVRYAGNSSYGSIGCNYGSVVLNNCTIPSSAGYGISVGAPTAVTITNCTVSSAALKGISVSLGSNPVPCTITGNTISQGADSGIYISGNHATVFGNTLSSNAKYGLLSDGSITALNQNFTGNTLGGVDVNSGAADARLSWWGDVSGPNAGAGTGSGAAVVGTVNYNPWRKAAVTATPLVRLASFDATTISPAGNVKMWAVFDEASNWTLSILNSSQTVVRSYSGSGTVLNQTWDGKNSSGTVVPAGTYTVDWTATSQPNPSRSEQLRGTLTVKAVTSIATVSGPLQGQLIVSGDVVSITGTIQGLAGGDTLSGYDLMWGFGSEPATWNYIANVAYSGTSPVNINQNFTVPAPQALMLTLRLRTLTSAGVSRSVEVPMYYVSPDIISNAIFSPVNGGVQFGTTTINSQAGIFVPWSLSIKDSSNVVINTVALPTSQNISYTWNGQNSGGAVVSDGTYTLALTATGINSGNTKTVSFTTKVDDTPPTLAITSPAANALISGSIAVTGTATDSNFVNYILEYGVGATPAVYTQIGSPGTTQVTGGQLGVWNLSSLPEGVYTLRLRSTDAVGNTATATVPVQIAKINFSNVSCGTQFAPAIGETNPITFTVDKPANVTASIYTVSWTMQANNLNFDTSVVGTTPVATLQLTAAAAGAYTINWNGRTGPNNTYPLVADGCYLVTLSATQTGSTLVGSYNPPYPTNIGLNYVVDPTSISETPAPPAQFNPSMGIGLTVSYTLPAAGFGVIQAYSGGSRVGDVMIAQPRSAGAHSEIWDGRYGIGTASPGQIVPNGNYHLMLRFTQTPVNSCIVDNKLSVSALDIEQSRILELYYNVATISYSLSRPCNVTIDIKEPNGNEFVNLLANSAQAAGSHSLEWNGLDSSARIAETEGTYQVVVTAVETSTGITTKSTTNFEINK